MEELHVEELRKLYSLPNIISVIRAMKIKRGSHVACMKGLRVLYKIYVIKPTVKRKFGRRYFGLGESITLK
jgi:hypothetical protein